MPGRPSRSPWHSRPGTLALARIRPPWHYRRDRPGLLFRHRAEADRQPVPAIDRHGGQRQVHQLLVGKLLARLLVDFVRNVVNRDERYGLRPGQRCSFAFGKEGAFAPGNEGIEALFGFAARPRGFDMQVESIRAPVDLRRANFDEFD